MNSSDMNSSEWLKKNRLIFYQAEVEKIDFILEEFLRLSGAKCAFLIDKEGHVVTRRGETKTLDLDTISALAAGSFAATREMAKLLGEERFSVLFHQGERDNIQLSLVGDRSLLVVIFDDRTTIGMVRLYASQASERLKKIFEKQAAPEKDEGIGGEFTSTAKDKLTDIFG